MGGESICRFTSGIAAPEGRYSRDCRPEPGVRDVLQHRERRLLATRQNFPAPHRKVRHASAWLNTAGLESGKREGGAVEVEYAIDLGEVLPGEKKSRFRTRTG